MNGIALQTCNELMRQDTRRVSEKRADGAEPGHPEPFDELRVNGVEGLRFHSLREHSGQLRRPREFFRTHDRRRVPRRAPFS
jgi:hypothetical protein